MPAWTKPRKQSVLRELGRVNAAIDRALEAVRKGRTADAADEILTCILHKHLAIDAYPPIIVEGDLAIPAGRLFRAWSLKDLFVSQALAAGADPQGNHSELERSLQHVISGVLDLVVLPWTNQACADRLKQLERELRALKSLLATGVGQDTPARRKIWWDTVGRIRTLQAEFLDCIYGDDSHGMSRTFLGLIEIDSRFVQVLDTLREWERETGAPTDPRDYLKNMLDTIKEDKDEIEERIRAFSF